MCGIPVELRSLAVKIRFADFGRQCALVPVGGPFMNLGRFIMDPGSSAMRHGGSMMRVPGTPSRPLNVRFVHWPAVMKLAHSIVKFGYSRGRTISSRVRHNRKNRRGEPCAESHIARVGRRLQCQLRLFAE